MQKIKKFDKIVVMIIKSIKLKSKSANTFIATNQFGNQFLLHSDAIVQYKIKSGEVDDEIFLKCVDVSNNIIATNLAVKYLNSSIKTEKQIKDYLYKKGYHSPTVNFVVEKLKSYNMINDKQYAESYIKSNPNFSKKKLQQKLAQVGVKKENIADDIDSVDEAASCLKSAQKFAKSHVMDKQNMQKLTRRLISQGYGWDTIKSTLNTLDFDTDEFE